MSTSKTGDLTPLTTQRLVLRAPVQDDIGDLYRLYGDAQAMRYWSTAPHADLSTTQDRLDRMIAAAAKRLTYMMIERDGRVIGTAGLYRGTEIGFILHPDYWRQGIVSEAMRALIPYLFETTDAPELTADADPRNVASLRTLQSLGFVETHRASNTFFVSGEWSDSIYFALPRPRA